MNTRAFLKQSTVLQMAIVLPLFCFCLLLTTQGINGQVQNGSQDVNTLLRIKPVLDTSLSSLLSWSIGNPLCVWRGVQWVYKDGSLLNCSLPQTALNSSFWQDPTVFVYSIDLMQETRPLSGSVPSQLGLLSNLHSLNLSNNNLTGPIPEEIGNSSSLSVLDLSNNSLKGSIPGSIWRLCGVLTELNLDHNQLQGSIPVAVDPNTKCSNLSTLRLNNNNLSGTVPAPFLKNIAPNLAVIDLSNNIFLGGGGEGAAKASAATIAPSPANSNSGTFGGAALGARARTGSRLSAGAVSGIIIGTLVAVVLLVSVIIGVCTSRDTTPLAARLTTSPSLKREIDEAEDATTGRLVSFEGGERFTADQVLNASGEVLGKTSYGTVYKAKLQTGATFILRLLRDGTVKDRDEFVSAVKELGLIRHRNLVPLRAYYHGPKDEKLLVYDYVPKGNLQDVLHRSTPYAPSPPWVLRHKIALGTARGLAHLHMGLHFPMVHGNLKAKNILVDDNFEPHLSDYGLHLLMTTAAGNDLINVQSQQGYKAPELTRIKKANTKSDIYSFGIVLLELLTGKKPGNLTTVNGETMEVELPNLVKTAVLEEKTAELFDLDLLRGMRTPAEDGLLQALQLAMGCCAPSPAVRPDIREVIRQLEAIRPKIYSPYMHSPFMTTPPDSRNSPRMPLSRPNELANEP